MSPGLQTATSDDGLESEELLYVILDQRLWPTALNGNGGEVNFNQLGLYSYKLHTYT